MRWLDVCGPPGVGKSTLCDPLWGPHAIDFAGVRQLPPDWETFVRVIDKLMHEIRDHPSISAMDRMLWRSLRKIAVVREMMANPGDVYIQTALAQRGLGFGWRLLDVGKVDKVRAYFEVMPVSLGVVLLVAPLDVVQDRNKRREDVQETAHENRAVMVERMGPAIEIMRDTLKARGVPYRELSTTQPIDDARRQLVDYAAGLARNPTQVRPSSEAPALSPSPYRWG